jgi:hypothetical protein
MTRADRFRGWVWIAGAVFFSSLFLFFLFWSFSVTRFLDGLRERSASSAHMLLVFGAPPSDKEVSGIKVELEKLVGPGNVISMSELSEKKSSPSFRSRKVLSITISLGVRPDGKIVTISEQVQSIQSLMKNDAQIQEVIFNPDWVAKVDEIALISERLRFSLKFFLILLFLGAALYWGSVSGEIGRWIFSNPAPDNSMVSKDTRLLLFRREPVGGENGAVESNLPSPPESEAKKAGPSPRISAAIGLFCGILAMVFAWTTKSMMYPVGMDPFQDNEIGFISHVPVWIAFPLVAGLAGLLGGFATTILRPPKNDGEAHPP